MRITREWVERLRADPPNPAEAELGRDMRRAERAVETGRSDGDVVDESARPVEDPWPVRKVKEPER